MFVTVLIGGVLYWWARAGITDMNRASQHVLWALATGSRFESIERGVIDCATWCLPFADGGLFGLICSRWMPSVERAANKDTRTHVKHGGVLCAICWW